MLLVCAVLLALGQLMVGSPRQALPDLVWLAIASLIPPALATRVVKMPGAASAVCGAYLLPRALGSLADATLDPPPLLLVPALAFDLGAWLRTSDLTALWRARRRHAWQRPDRRPRRLTLLRAAVAGALFSLVLVVIEPPFALLLGGDPAMWSGQRFWPAAALCVLVSAAIGVIARDTGS